jgi:3-oxoacyl-[acyl-carrier-protein] synthase-3
MSQVRLAATAGHLPSDWIDAAAIAAHSGIPESVVVGRFGLRRKHLAAPDEHVSDLSVAAAAKLLAETGCGPGTIDAVCYFGSTYKEYAVWQAAPHIAHRLGVRDAFALELDYVSCGGPVAIRICRDMLVAEPELRRVLLVGASRESYLVDYENPRSRFMIGFGDGAVAALLERGETGPEVLGSAALTDGSLSLAVKVPVGGSVQAVRGEAGEPPFLLDTDDPESLKDRLDKVSLDHFVLVAREALRRSGLEPDVPISLLCPLHTKRSMFKALCSSLGVAESRAVYLDDTGHMSGVDSLFGLDRAARAGMLEQGDIVVLIAAGTGYTWAATVIRWG